MKLCFLCIQSLGCFFSVVLMERKFLVSYIKKKKKTRVMFLLLWALTTILAMQVVSNESKSSPLILFVKDIEKAMVGHSDAYSILKGRLENLPGNVVVIGSHTHMDSRKEKVSRAFFLPPPLFLSLRVCLDSFNSIFYPTIIFSPILVVFYLPSLEATKQLCLILLSRYVNPYPLLFFYIPEVMECRYLFVGSV